MNEIQKTLRRNRHSKPERPMPWWQQQVRERPLATMGTVVSITGGLLLLIFFCQLGGMPELDLAGASAILMAVAAVGFVLAVALTGCSIGVGLMLRGNEQEVSDLKTPLRIWFLVLPGGLSILALACYLAVKPNGDVPTWGYSLPFIPMVIFSLIHAFLAPGHSVASAASNGAQAKLGRGLIFFFLSCLWLYIAASAFFTFFVIYPRDGDKTQFLVGLVAWTAWCYASNTIMAKATKVGTLALLSGCCAASLVALVIMTGNLAGLPVAVVRALGLGEIPVALVLTAEGCDYLNKAAGGRPVCRIKVGEKTATVCPAILRSRIGSPFFVELSPYDDKGRWPQARPVRRLLAIAIPKSEVPSWSRLEPMLAASASKSKTSGVVTYLDPAAEGSWVHEQCGASPFDAPSNPAILAPALLGPKVLRKPSGRAEPL